MAYVVGPAERRAADPGTPGTLSPSWPIVFEDPDLGVARTPFASSRELAEKIATALNDVLSANGLLKGTTGTPAAAQ